MCPYTISFKQGSRVLEIGGGENKLPGTLNMDVRDVVGVDVKWDMNKVPYPFESNSFDGVVGLYILEHLSWKSIENVVSELFRILKDGGKGIFLVPNTFEQCKVVASSDSWDDGFSCMLYGSQDYNENAHACAFSPEYAKQLFKSFKPVKVISPMPDVFFGDKGLYPKCDTDMIIEVHKMEEKNMFEREYFEDGTIGYKQYRDFPQHYATARKIMVELDLRHLKYETGKSRVLEIGAARGYVTRILENNGVKAVAMDISKYCYYTRATNNFILHDLTDVPWHKAHIFDNKEFDLCFSQNVLEHIPEEQIDKVITEIARVSIAGLHGIHYTGAPYKESPDIDITHYTMHSKEWWEEKFKLLAPEYKVTIMYPRELENDDVEKCIAYPPKPPDNLVKLNIGSFMDMFYNWINIDIIDLRQFAESYGYQFQQHDVTQRLPCEDNSIDLIFSSHLLEHLSREEGAKFLKECHRALKPNGIIRIITPDAEILTTEYLNGEIWKYKYINTGVEKAKDKAEAFHELLMGGHKTIYDKGALDNMLKEAGFELLPSITPFTSNSDAIQKQTITNFPNLSLVVEAKKP